MRPGPNRQPSRLDTALGGLPSALVWRSSAASSHDLIHPSPSAGAVQVPFDPVLDEMLVTGEQEIHLMLAEERHTADK